MCFNFIYLLAKQAAISSASHLTEEEIEEKIDKGDISIFSSAIIQVLMENELIINYK